MTDNLIFSDLLKIRKIVELQNPHKINNNTGRDLKKLYRNDAMKDRISKARDRLIARKEREGDPNEEFRGVKGKFKKFTNKKKGGKKAKKGKK